MTARCRTPRCVMLNVLRPCANGTNPAPIAFARALNIEADARQEEVLRSPSKRTLLNCSRQAGKSTVASVRALHLAYFRPMSLALLISPSLRQSAELFRKIAQLVELLPTKALLREDNKLSMRLENGSRIVSLTSSEATIRGFSGAHLIVEDESSRVPDDLYRPVRRMLATSAGSLLLMSTPFGKRGHFFEEWERGGDQWERVCVPATACPRIAPSFLAEERASLGEWWFRQEYLCEFVETVDQVFGFDIVSRAVTSEVKPLFARVTSPPSLPPAIQPLFGSLP